MITLDAITLPADLEWVDEFAAWSPLVRRDARSISGALVRQVSTQQGGRPITLASGSDAWATRSTVVALQAKLDAPDADMTLSLHGTDYTVRFAPDNPLTATPILRVSPPDDDDPYAITLRLIEVTP